MNSGRIAENIPEVNTDSKESNLKVGDVVLVMTKIPLKSKENYRGVISADGVISKSVVLIPKDSQHGANVQTRSCLFRIENARKVDSGSEQTDSELMMAMGKSLTYGERIQLRHWHSKGFLSVSTHNIALEAGCLEIYVSDQGNEDSWFEILPVNKLRKTGEVIKYTDSLYLKCSYEKSAYFLHFNDMTLENPEGKTEVNACGNYSNWRLKKYMSYDLSIADGTYATTGDSFRIFHKISEGYLTVTESKIVIENDVQEEQEVKPKVFVQKGNKNSCSLWELQRLSTFVGGIAMWSESFRIKHLATGQFLKKENGTLILTSKCVDDTTKFELLPQSSTSEKEIRFGVILSIKNSGEMLKVEYQEELTTLIEQKNKDKYELSFAKSKKDYSTVAFVLEDVPETNTAHVYKLALMIPKLVDAYDYLQRADLTQKVLVESPEKESLLKQTCDHLHIMLGNVKKYVIHSTASEVDIIKRQSSMREIGVIDALIKLADLIQYRIQSSIMAPILERGPIKTSYKVEKENLVSFYLSPLEGDLYKLVYDSVKNNPKNSRNLIDYEDRIIPLLSSKNFHSIGKILREMFKFIMELSKYSERRIDRWFACLQPGKFETNDIRDYSMYLSMMKYLCQADGLAAVSYQAEFKDKIFADENSMKIIKMHVINNRPCIELDCYKKTANLNDILRASPHLSSLELIKQDELIDLNREVPIFYLDDLCRDKEYGRYVASAVDFYCSMCLDRYTPAIDQVKKYLFVTPRFLISAINSNVNLKLRASFIEFLITVFIDVDPYVPVSKFKPRCYDWEDNPNSRCLIRMDNVLKKGSPEFFDEIAKNVMNFWNSDHEIVFDEIGGTLKLVTAYLKLTKVLLDFEVFDVDFLFKLQENLIYLIMGVSETHVHWCCLLVSSARQLLDAKYRHSLEHSLSFMLEETMNALSVMMIRRENLHVELLCNIFFDYIQEKNTESDFTLGSERMKKLYQDALSKLEWKIVLEGGTYHLDIYLLHLLFNSEKSVNKEVRKKALEMILADLNLRNTLKKELFQVEFLNIQTERDKYTQVFIKSGELSIKLKTLLSLQAEKVIKPEYNICLKEASIIILDILQLFKSESQNTSTKERMQTIMRHTNVLDGLSKVLLLKNTSHKVLYRNTINLMYNFVLDNPKNQELLLPFVDELLGKIEVGLGVTKLLAQILNKNSKLRKGNRVIKLISESIDSHPYEYHLIQLLRTFAYDEKMLIIPKMQIDILKWAFNNKSIKQMHLQHSSHYDYLDPKIPPNADEKTKKAAKKFHCEVIKTINVCTCCNRFGIMQGRKLITLANLIKTLKKPEIPKQFKKHYLKFLYEAYMNGSTGEKSGILGISVIEDIFKELIIKDLDYALETIDAIVGISQKGMYKNIPCTRGQDLKISAFMQLIVASNPNEFADESTLEEKRIMKKVKLNEKEQEVLDHWNYLSGGQAWHSEKDGVLHIIRDMLLTENFSSEQYDFINDIKNRLKFMVKTFEDYEKRVKNLDFSNILLIINACREACILRENEEGEDETIDKVQNEKVQSLVVSLRESIIDRKMSLEEVFSLFDSDKNGNISKTEFKNGIKCLLNHQRFDIDSCFAYFAEESDSPDSNSGSISMRVFSTKLRTYFYNNRISREKKKTEKMKTLGKVLSRPEGFDNNEYIKTDFKSFLDTFSELCKDQDIHELVFKIRKSFVNPAIASSDFTILKEFVSKLGTAFKRKEHKIYLLQILKLLIPSDLKINQVFDTKSNELKERLEDIRKTQEILSKSGVLELALTIISSEHELELVDEAVQLLLSMMKFGNQKVQEKFLEILKLSDNSYLFSYIRLKLRQSRDRIVDRAKATYEKNPEKALQGKVSNEELERNNIYIECAIERSQSMKKPLHVEKLIKLLQYCCENCYSDFQHYIRSQDNFSFGKKAISINMVNEIAQYLINIKEVGPELINDEEAIIIIPQCYETLIDLCRGPCIENQLLLGQRRKLYKFVDNIINEKKFGRTFYTKSVSFLKVLLEGEVNKDIGMTMLEEINFECLSGEALKIYTELIHNNKDAILEENINIDDEESFLPCKGNSKPLELDEWIAICSGFDIIIIFLKLKSKFPDSAKLKRLSLDSSNERIKTLANRILKLGGRQESLYQGLVTFFKLRFTKKAPNDITHETAYEFYLSLLASVEIDRDGYLEQSFFRVPAMIVFLSNNMRDKLLYELNRNSHEEKIKSVFHNSEVCQIHMFHLQKLSRFKTLSWWSSKSKSLADISFIMIVLVNLILLFSISSPSDDNFNIGTFPGRVFLTILGVILIVVSISVYLMFIVENYPEILYERFDKPKDSDIYKLPSANKLQGTVLVKYYAESTSHDQKDSIFDGVFRVLYVFFYSENLYNLVYIVLVCVAWKTVFVYPFLLLDIVRRNENLRYILRAVTQNKRQLGLTVLLGLIIVYLFGVVGFLSFSEFYDQGTACDTLLSCVTYTLYYGVRAGGGVGDALDSPDKNNSLYSWRHVFDLLFFIIVIIILLNIIFGIIIDTFGELRDKRKKIEEDVNNFCIICGREKYEFELRGSGWNEHIQLEHNLFSYLAYIIYIRRNPLSECDGLEKYVKNKIAEGDVSFLPKTAMCLEKGEKGEQNNMIKDIDMGIKNIEDLLTKFEASHDS